MTSKKTAYGTAFLAAVTLGYEVTSHDEDEWAALPMYHVELPPSPDVPLWLNQATAASSSTATAVPVLPNLGSWLIDRG